MRNFFRTSESFPTFSRRERVANAALLHAGGDLSHQIAMKALEQGFQRIALERAHEAAVSDGTVIELDAYRQDRSQPNTPAAPNQVAQ